jgi:hypothetical protein
MNMIKKLHGFYGLMESNMYLALCTRLGSGFLSGPAAYRRASLNLSIKWSIFMISLELILLESPAKIHSFRPAALRRGFVWLAGTNYPPISFLIFARSPEGKKEFKSAVYRNSQKKEKIRNGSRPDVRLRRLQRRAVDSLFVIWILFFGFFLSDLYFN